MTFEGLQIQGAVKIMEKLTVSRKERNDMKLIKLFFFSIYVT
jgi:hypothetical protein